MIKRITALFLTLAMCLSAAVIVSAAAPVVTVEANKNVNALVVSGKLTTERGNVTLVLRILDSADQAVYIDTVNVPYDASKNGVYDYKFAPVNFPADCATGTYTIEVSGSYISQAATVSYDHTNPVGLYNSLKAVQSALNSGNDTDLANALETNKGELGIDFSIYENLRADGKEAFCDYLYTKAYLPLTGKQLDLSETEIFASLTQIQEQITNLNADYLQAHYFGVYNGLTGTGEVSSWIETNKAKFNADIPATTDIKEDELYGTYVTSVLRNDDFAARLTARPILISDDDIRNAIYEDALLTIIKTGQFAEGRAVVEGFPTLFVIGTGAFSNLDSDGKAWVYEQLPGAYASYAAVVAEMNRLAGQYVPPTQRTVTMPTGVKNSAAGATIITTPKTEETAEEAPGQLFTDVSADFWANEAITYLAGKKIVSGRDNGSFEPDDNITRSEFVKLFVLALGKDASEAAALFNDVDKQAWYAPYVAAAYYAGLVTGNEENNFMPDSLITREDMAVMIYRAYTYDGYKPEACSFVDKQEICDYALDAVSMLSNEGIINGVGDGRFDPHGNATRAQAVQVIYNMMK